VDEKVGSGEVARRVFQCRVVAEVAEVAEEDQALSVQVRSGEGCEGTFFTKVSGSRAGAGGAGVGSRCGGGWVRSGSAIDAPYNAKHATSEVVRGGSIRAAG
jgi:hypothetical protein